MTQQESRGQTLAPAPESGSGRIAAADPASRSARNDREVRRVLIFVFWLNLVVAAAKILYGMVSGSVAIRADGIHSLFDCGSNIVGLIAIWIASHPPDAQHPYGHRKFESMAALLIGVAVISGFLEVVRNLVNAVRSGSEPQIDNVGFLVAGGTLLVNLAVTTYEHRAGRRLGSELLVADARHTLSDIFATLGVIAGFIGVTRGYPTADLVAAGVVCVLIANTAYQIFRESSRSLLDTASLDPEEVALVATALPGVIDCHKVRSRGSGSHIHVDLHIHVAPEMTVQAAHDLTHEVEMAIRTRFPGVADVIIHTEPAGDEEP
jgi:cation diffusion facilitator family transporter